MSRRRRTRYTVDVEGREPVVVLSYTHGGAIETAQRHGYKVLSAVTGDYRKQARAREVKAKGGFRINRSALEQAKFIMGLKLPVKIRYNNRVGDTNGNYEFHGTYHDVMLKRYHTPEQATRTLWHELTHAQQAERCGDLEIWERFRKAQRRFSYQRRPMEIEARNMSANMSPNHPLTTQ